MKGLIKKIGKLDYFDISMAIVVTIFIGFISMFISVAVLTILQQFELTFNLMGFLCCIGFFTTWIWKWAGDL